MSVTKCRLIRSGRSGSADKKYRREITEVYRVETNSTSDGWPTVLVQTGNAGLDDPIPNLWSTYNIGNSFDFGIYLQDKRGQLENPAESNQRWLVTCTWRAPEPGDDPENGDDEDNPLLRATKYRLDWANYSRVATKDKNGTTIENSAGVEFDPPIEIDDARPVLVCTRNEWPLGSIIANSIQYKNAINTDSFYGAGPREAKVESIVCGDIMNENGVQFYQVTYRFQFNDQKWDITVVDQGFSHLDENGELVDAMERTVTGSDVEWTKVSEPVGLKTDGTRQAKGVDKLFKEFRVYPELSFSALGL